MNNQFISDVLREYESNSKKRETLKNHKITQIHKAIPEIIDIDKQISLNMISISKSVLSGLNTIDISKIRLKVEDLKNTKKQHLVRNGFSESYLDDHFDCPICNDSGYKRDKLCDCVKKKADSLSNRQNGFSKSNAQSFDNFHLGYCSKIVDERYKISPYDHMSLNLKDLINYSQKFSLSSDNLLFLGANGTSKTHLANSIAKVVRESGYNVVFESSSTIFDNYESKKFSGFNADISEKIESYKNCDLLVLDGLGYEMITAFTVTALYSLVSYRLDHGKPMIVTTTFTMKKIEEKYSDALVSRFKGNFEDFFFFGDDMRRKIKEMRK